MPIRSALIRASAKKIFNHYNKDCKSSFNLQASEECFEKFKKRHNLHNIKLSGESASMKQLKNFPQANR